MPSYTKEEFLRMIDIVEEQGGAYLDTPHDVVVHDDLKADDDKPVTQNCGEPALFEVPYEPSGYDGTIDSLVVCGVDDLMGLWPRFASANAKSGLR